MITPIGFWEAYRSALISPNERPPDLLNSGWTSWTCDAACAACRALGLIPVREHQRFDVVGLRAAPSPERPWAVAYEHEGGLSDHWKEELYKLWSIEADLRVLVGYPARGSHPSTVQGKLQEEANKLRREHSDGFKANWLFLFGVGNSKKYPTEPWNVWRLSEGGVLVAVEGATDFYPRRDIGVG
jgi:hypothetical protein